MVGVIRACAWLIFGLHLDLGDEDVTLKVAQKPWVSFASADIGLLTVNQNADS